MMDIVERIIIERNKKVDSLVFGEIKEMAAENGIDTTIILNETAIVEALKKQIPAKPDLESDGYDENGNLIYDTGYCPNCRHMFEVDYDATDYCPACGQALDWSDIE